MGKYQLHAKEAAAAAAVYQAENSERGREGDRPEE